MTIQMTNVEPPRLDNLLSELREMIDQTRWTIATTTNSSMTMLYWRVGNRIRKEILNDKRAEYGQKIVATLWRQLSLEYGKGFQEKGLRRMIQFSEVFPDENIVAALARQLTWSHFRLLLPSKTL